MTTIARLLPDRDRERLLARLRELRETARLMEERGSLAARPRRCRCTGPARNWKGDAA